MKNFNLLISTSRFNETNAATEMWFTLLMCGDNYPIISKLTFPGLISALSNIDAKKVILKIQQILKKDPHFFQFILNIIPIDFICETNIKILANLIQENSKTYIKEGDSFKIVLKRRKHEKIERNNAIERIANRINNKVDLENPDKVIRIEVLGNFCAVSFLKRDDIIKIGNL
ncbi:MAG: THUMP domain-containing protein [Candidatus Hodarchaeota archaeon]